MNKLLLSAVLLAGTALSAPASAATIDWNFQDHPGLRGNSQTFTAGGLTLTARGFDFGDVGTALFVKNAGGDESGLGLANDPSGDNEIAKGFVQINLDGIKGLLLQNGFSFQMGSTTQGEGWVVYGSNDDHPFLFTQLAHSLGNNDEGFHTLAGGWDNYNFFYDGGPAGAGHGGCGNGCDANVLLTNFDATLNAVPLPPAVALFGAGLAGIGWITRRRKQKALDVATA